MVDSVTYQRQFWHTPQEVRTLLLVAGLVVGLLDSHGLVDRCGQMQAGRARQVCLNAAEALDVQTTRCGLGLPVRALHMAFQQALAYGSGTPLVVDNPAPVIPLANQTTPLPAAPRPKPPAPPLEPVYTAERPLTVLLIGDSQMVKMEGSLRAALGPDAKLKVTADAHIGTGLSRPDHLDWPAHMRNVLARQRYDVVVVFIGSNDTQNITDDGQVHKTLSPGWVEVYRRRVDDFTEALSAARHVYWIGLPPMRKVEYDQQVKQVIPMHREACGGHSNIRYFDTFELVADADGGYLSHVEVDGRSLEVRNPDGQHFTRAGYRLVAGQVVKLIRSDTFGAGRKRQARDAE